MAIGTLTIDFVAKLASLQQSMDKAAHLTERSARRMERAFAGVSKNVRNVFGAFAAYLGARVIVQSFKTTIDALDNLNKASQSTGVAVEALSELRYAAQLSGVEAEGLDKALSKLAGRMSEAGSGSAEAAEVFKRMGLNIKNASGGLITTEQALKAIADKFASFRDGTNKTALAIDLFGERIGPRLIPLLNQGAAGFAKLAEEARKLGIVVSGAQASDAERFNDALFRLSRALEQLKLYLTTGLLGALADFSEELIKARVRTDSWWRAIQAIGTRKTLEELNEDLQTAYFNLSKDPGNPKIIRRIEYLTDAMDVLRDRAKVASDAVVGAFVAGANAIRALEPGVGRMGLADAPRAADTSKKTDKERDAVDRLIESLEKQKDALLEITEVEKTLRDFGKADPKGRFAAERARAVELARIIDLLKDQKKAIDELERGETVERASLVQAERKEWEEMVAVLERINELEGGLSKTAQARIDAAQKLFALGKITEEQVGAVVLDNLEVLDRYNKKVDKAKSITEELGLSFESAFEQAVIGANKASDALKALGDDIIRIFARKFITSPIASAVSGLISSYFPGLASGGPVSAGGAYVVGERGPELFVPRQSGTVVPGVGMNVSLNVVNQGPPVRAEAQQRQTSQGMVIDLVLREVEADVQRGGRVSTAFARQFGLNRAAGLAR